MSDSRRVDAVALALAAGTQPARAAGLLEHPNVVRTHDIDQDGNLHFIVMEYVDGSNLLDIVKKHGPLDIRRATSYARQVASGLDYALIRPLKESEREPPVDGRNCQPASCGGGV